MYLLKLKVFIISNAFAVLLAVSLLSTTSALCIGTSPASCLIELSEEEANETLKYVLSKYEEVEMKIIGEPVSIYGMRLLYGDAEEELNIHFKYIDNTQYDIIQNCVFALYHRQNECELIRTICNTFLPITPRPLMQRKDLRVCKEDGSDVQLVEKEELDEEDDDDDEDGDKTTMATTTDKEQVGSNGVAVGNNSAADDGVFDVGLDDDGDDELEQQKQKSPQTQSTPKQRSSEAENSRNE